MANYSLESELAHLRRIFVLQPKLLLSIVFPIGTTFTTSFLSFVKFEIEFFDLETHLATDPAQDA